MRTGIWGPILVGSLLVAVGVPLTGGAAPGDQFDEDTVTGAAFEVTPEQEEELHELVDDITDNLLFESREHAFMLVNSEGTYFVYTDDEPRDAEVSVTGTVITSDETDDVETGVIFADSIDWKTEGEPISNDELFRNTDEYEYELVRVSGEYRQLAYAIDAADSITEFQTAGVFESPFDQPVVETPGRTAQWATLNLSSTDVGDERSLEIYTRLAFLGGGLFVSDRSDTRWWIDSETRLDVLVREAGDGHALDVVDVSPTATDVGDTDELSDHAGDVVRIDASVMGTRTSTKELLLSAAGCGTDMAYVPGTTACVPVVTDTAVHSGVLFTETPRDRSDVVVYIGLSNHHQSQVTTARTGEYTVTGRVVDTDQIDPRLPEGYGLIVYGMDRRGDLSIDTDGPETWAGELTEMIEDQVTASPDEWETIVDDVETEAEGPDDTETDGDSNADESAAESETEASDDGDDGTDSTTEGSTNSESRERDSSESGDESRSAPDLEITDTRIGMNPVEVDQGTVVIVEITNHGERAGEISLAVKFGDEPFRDRTVSVPAETTKEYRFEYYPTEEGEVPVSVNGEEVGVIQVGDGGVLSTGQPGFTPLVSIVAVLVLVSLARIRRAGNQ